MRIAWIIAAAGLASFGAAQAAELAPADVPFGENGEVEVSLSGVAGNPEEGLKVFTSRGDGNCVACHTVSALIESVPFHGNVGPPLDGVASRWNEAEIRGIVANAKNVYDGTIMPSFYKGAGYIRPGEAFTMKPADEPLPPLLTAQQIEDLVAYLMTLTE
jgi:sulfur-oxidizing protein SoxX